MENDTWKQITDSMRRPQIIADPANPAGPMIHQADFVMSAKSLTRYKIASDAVSYYEMTYCLLSVDIMMYGSRLKNFKVHMYSIKYMKKYDASKPTNI